MAKFKSIIEEAVRETDEQFQFTIASLTRLNQSEVEKLIADTKIDQADFAEVIKTVKEAGRSNDQKAAAIQNISKGVDLLVGIAAKLL